jgi:hypothetical protein
VPDKASTNLEPRTLWALAAGLAAVSLILWWPALQTPFWGDDYIFLQNARAARLAGEPWWRAFWPDIQYRFWRPLSQDAWWTWIEGPLRADARLAHAANLALWIVSCLAVGLCSMALGRSMDWSRPALLGALTAAVYSLLALSFVPIHWVCAANSSFLMLWTGLALTAWTSAPRSSGWRRIAACLAVPLLQVVALLSKESGALLPLLMAACSLMAWPRVKPGIHEALAWLACWVAIALWLVLRARFTLDTDSSYDLAFGTNLIRNTGALFAWLLNVPRESIRLVVEGSTFTGLLWAGAALAPMIGAAYLVMQAIAGKTCGRQGLAFLLFVGVAYGPYFFLVWNNYAYYAATAGIATALLIGRGLEESPHALLISALLVLSSAVSVEGSRRADYPSLIGRARWAEQELTALGGYDIDTPLAVKVNNAHQFYAIGPAGLAWRLGVPESQVVFPEKCLPRIRRWLVQQEDGRFRWQDCPVAGEQ